MHTIHNENDSRLFSVWGQQEFIVFKKWKHIIDTLVIIEKIYFITIYIGDTINQLN